MQTRRDICARWQGASLSTYGTQYAYLIFDFFLSYSIQVEVIDIFSSGSKIFDPPLPQLPGFLLGLRPKERLFARSTSSTGRTTIPTTAKRDLLAAEARTWFVPFMTRHISSLNLLMRMPHYISTAFYRKKETDRRCTKYDSFSAGLGRKHAATGTTHIELETLLRERNT